MSQEQVPVISESFFAKNIIKEAKKMEIKFNRKIGYLCPF